MTSLKRPAEEPLLPLRDPKQPRRAMKGYNGGKPSPSEIDGARSRWNHGIYQVVFNFLPRWTPVIGWSEKPIEDDVASDSSISSISSVATPRQTPAPEVTVILSDNECSQGGPISPPEKNSKPTPLQSYFASRPSPFIDSSIPSSRTPSCSFNDLSLSTSRDTVGFGEGAFQSTPKPRNTQASTSTTSTDVFPSLSRSLTRESTSHSMSQISGSPTRSLLQPSQIPSSSSNRVPSLSPKRITTPKRSLHRHRERQHIFANVHKANVQRHKHELRDEMKHQLFEIKKKRGYTSDFRDFEGLLRFQLHLESLKSDNGTQMPKPSSSFMAGKIPARRPEVEAAFLRRALDSAKATLESPKPQKPFLPSLEQLQISHRAKDDAIERRLRPPLPDKLPEKEDQEVTALLQKRGPISKFAKEAVDDDDIRRLEPKQWLNDEIINFYGAMILARSEERKTNTTKGKEKALLDIHYFSSFFWTKLMKDGYQKARLNKWTKKFDIFAKDAVLMPINHHNAHWTAASINFRKKRIESYDSMHSYNDHVFPLLRNYLNAEHLDKKKKPFDFTGWVNWAPEDTPRQENGYDCGVFTTHFLEALSRGEETFAFRQKNMPYLRRRMIWEIGNAQLRGGHYA